MIEYTDHGSYIEITNIWTAPEDRGKGLASKELLEFLAQPREFRLEAMPYELSWGLEYIKEEKRLIKWYRRFGFKSINRLYPQLMIRRRK